MALSAATVWEIRNTADYAGASDTNGGGFVTGASGTDWSYASINSNGSAKYSTTCNTAASTTVALTIASSDMVGNIAYIAGGSGSLAAGWYQITGYSAGVSITVDRTIASSTGATINIGGALASPGMFASVGAATGNSLWIRYSTTPYGVTTTTAGTNGPLVPGVAAWIGGYDQARGDNTGNRPTLQWQTAPGSLTYLVTLSASNPNWMWNLSIDANTKTNGACVSIGARSGATNCVASNATQTSTIGFSGGRLHGCKSANCLTGYSQTSAVFCLATGTTGQTGFTISSAVNCIASGMATGFSLSGGGYLLTNCVADGCTTVGFTLAYSAAVINCIASNCTGSATGFAWGSNQAHVYNCAAYNNTTNCSGTPLSNLGPWASGATLTSLGADPYVNRAGGDFRPNANTPGGAQLRDAGLGVYGQTDNRDIGAVQHTDPTGGGNTYIFQVES